MVGSPDPSGTHHPGIDLSQCRAKDQRSVKRTEGEGGATGLRLGRLALDEKTPLKPEQVLKLVNKKGTLWLTPDMRLVRSWPETERPRRLELAWRLLGELLEAPARA
jgi:hypothetical protein